MPQNHITWRHKPWKSLGSNIHIMHPKYWGFRREKDEGNVAKRVATDIFLLSISTK